MGNVDQRQFWLLDWLGFLVPSLSCRVSRESLKSPVIWIEKRLASLKGRKGLTWVSQNLGGEGSDHKQQAQKPCGDLHGGGRQLDVSALISASLPLCLSALLAILYTFIGSRVGGSFQRRSLSAQGHEGGVLRSGTQASSWTDSKTEETQTHGWDLASAWGRDRKRKRL